MFGPKSVSATASAATGSAAGIRTTAQSYGRVAGKLKPGENLIFLVADYSNPEHVAAGRAAATMLGARLSIVELG